MKTKKERRASKNTGKREMKYTICNNFKKETTTVLELLEVLNSQTERSEYPCYIAHVDSIYPIIGFSFGILGDDIASLSSRNNNEGDVNIAEPLTLFQLRSEMEHTLLNFPECSSYPVFAEAAENIDESLDMQLDEACAVRQWSFTEHRFAKDFYFVTGMPMDFC